MVVCSCKRDAKKERFVERKDSQAGAYIFIVPETTPYMGLIYAYRGSHSHGRQG